MDWCSKQGWEIVRQEYSKLTPERQQSYKYQHLLNVEKEKKEPNKKYSDANKLCLVRSARYRNPDSTMKSGLDQSQSLPNNL